MLHDWLSVSKKWREDTWTYRINFPGTVSDANWTLTLPFSVEELFKLDIVPLMQQVHQETYRA